MDTEDMVARLKRTIANADREFEELKLQLATLKLMLFFEESKRLDMRIALDD